MGDWGTGASTLTPIYHNCDIGLFAGNLKAKFVKTIRASPSCDSREDACSRTAYFIRAYGIVPYVRHCGICTAQ